MTAAAQKILIIGGGFSGMSAAIQLRKLGLDVHLVEIDAGWRSYGAGISLGGATLRAFGQLGVLDEFLRLGAVSDGLDLFLPQGQPIGQIPTPRIAGPDIPGGGAIMRPVLARILAEATRASGARIELGKTFSTIVQDAAGVEVSFSDGQRERYDLVIGADGLYSQTRQAIFPDAPRPRYSGQAVWRAVLPRPPELGTVAMWMGGKVKPGVNPVSATEMYLFITENRPVNDFVDPQEFPDRLRALLEEFTAPLMKNVRAEIGPQSQIVFRPLESLLLPLPWHRGRVVLIGDTVHATTPHMASGACIGIEDALVLAEEVGRHENLDGALGAFEQRRWDRCRMVVENSDRLGEIEITGGDKAEHGRIMTRTLAALAAAI